MIGSSSGVITMRASRGLSILGVFAFGGLAAADDAANFSGLKDKELKPLTGAPPAENKDIKKVSLGDLLGSIRGGGKKDKNLKINRVTVLEDRRTSLRVRFEYETDKKPLKISLWALGDRGKAVEDIKCEPITLTESGGELEATLRLGTRNPENAKPFSTLVLQFGVGSGTTLDALVGGIANGPGFECAKNWEPVPNVIKAKLVGPAPAPTPVGGGVGVVLRPSKYVSKAPYLANPGSSGDSAPVSSASGGSSVASSVLKKPWMVDSAVKLSSLTPAPGAPAPKGPGNMTVFDLTRENGATIKAFVDDLPLVFEDAEPASGYFYYKPNRYALGWSQKSSYDFSIIYGASGGEGAAKGVTLAARLKAHIASSDLAMIKKILQDGGRKVVAIKPFPIGTAPAYTLAEGLKSLGIKPESIQVTGASETGDELEIRVTTDVLTKETIQAQLTSNLGLAGDIVFESSKSGSGAEPVRVAIGAPIRLGDTLSFGSRSFNRQSTRAPFKNDTPYPVLLECLNLLKVSGSEMSIYQYSLGSVELQPGEQVEVDLWDVPAWIDTDPAIRRRWFQYSVQHDSLAAQSVIGGSTTGADSTTQSNVSVTFLEWKEKVPAVALRIEFRSKFFDPERKATLTKDFTAKGDGEAAQIGPFYLPPKHTGNFYEYRLTVIDAEGNEKTAKKWTSSDKSSMFIGVKQIRDVLDEK